MELNVLAATLIALSVLVAVGGRKIIMPAGANVTNVNTEKILLKTGAKYTSEENKALLKKKIDQAGLELEPEYFIGLQIALPILSIAVLLPFVILGLIDIIWVILPVLILFFLPRAWLNKKAEARVAKLNNELPDFCINFASVLDSGADFLTATTEVSHSMKGELSKEFLRAVDDMAVGKRRTDALYDMANRCGIPDLTNLVRRIDEAQRYGTPLADAVRFHTEKIMQRRKNEGQEKAGKLVIKLLFPIMIFILLPMMGLLFFPVGYHLMQAF
ncbi:type II secretion system F family protein [Desulfofalx alkaliphila]|uniref:type II secretion system F family protein n=1 Tax=Desulfofalx alkaliphila TaxID=105483 RepID=UPI0004E12242|nr:type II secretion system F family protein [Desulfofalx alkaliphila]